MSAHHGVGWLKGFLSKPIYLNCGWQIVDLLDFNNIFWTIIIDRGSVWAISHPTNKGSKVLSTS